MGGGVGRGEGWGVGGGGRHFRQKRKRKHKMVGTASSKPFAFRIMSNFVGVPSPYISSLRETTQITLELLPFGHY